jgi:hypothetical protein
MWVLQETTKSPQKIPGSAGKKIKNKKQRYYCVDIHIPNELHSLNLFSKPVRQGVYLLQF